MNTDASAKLLYTDEAVKPHITYPGVLHIPNLDEQTRLVVQWFPKATNMVSYNFLHPQVEKENLSDGNFVLPTHSAVANHAVGVPDDWPDFNKALHVVVHRIFPILEKRGIHVANHFKGLGPEYITLRERSREAHHHIERVAAFGSVFYVLPTQLGRIYGGKSARHAEELFKDFVFKQILENRIFEFGLDPVQAMICMAICLQNHPLETPLNMQIDCRGAQYSPSGDSKRYDDCPRVTVQADGKSIYMGFDWNWDQRPRELQGAASGFIISGM